MNVGRYPRRVGRLLKEAGAEEGQRARDIY